MTAALDRAVANAMGLKSVNNCEKWSKTMDETQPAQEPKFWEMPDGKIVNKWGLQFYNGVVGAALYTTPPPRPWVGLEKSDMPDEENPMFDHKYFIAGMVFASNVLKEKNT